MTKQNSQLVDLFIKEMQYRNYSERSVKTYSANLSALEYHFNKTLDLISTQEFKDFLHHKITITPSQSSNKQMLLAGQSVAEKPANNDR